MDDNTGTEGGACSESERAGGWFIVEAIVDRRTGDPISSDDDEEEDEAGEDFVDFIDDTRSLGDGQEVAQELFQQQTAADDDVAVQTVKRKFAPSPYFSPVCEQASIEHELRIALMISLRRSLMPNTCKQRREGTQDEIEVSMLLGEQISGHGQR